MSANLQIDKDLNIVPFVNVESDRIDSNEHP